MSLKSNLSNLADAVQKPNVDGIFELLMPDTPALSVKVDMESTPLSAWQTDPGATIYTTS